MADKKLLEESVIARFQQLANINGGSKAGVLTESAAPAGGKRRSATPVAQDDHGRRGPDLEESAELDNETVEEAYGADEAEGDETDADPMDVAGPDMGAPVEGGDLEAAVQEVIAGLNKVLAASGMSDKEVELDSGSEEGGESEEDMDAGGEEGEMPPVAEKKDWMKQEAKKSAKKPMEEEVVEEDDSLEESVELVDDALIEKLVQRVSARLVAEARKAKSLAEGKKGGAASVRKAAGGGVTKVAKKPAAKGSPVKGGTPFKSGKK